ncbi:MAG: Mur ligase family protein [Methanosphaera sp.]|nr:Mur ligase family protein [Methanosphaera sp.]
MSNVKYTLVKKFSQLTLKTMHYLPTGGKSYPGFLFLKYSGRETLPQLTSDQIDIGSIVITGTNGKTTTTTMTIDLLSNDMKLSTSVDNNTIYALTTGILKDSSELGVFEYGIRDIEHGEPDNIQRLIDPIGVVYTNISREHTQVLGVKNSFKDYVKAKTLLSQGMDKGVVITNCDDPNTAYIGFNKQDDVHVTYYGFELESLEDIFEAPEVKCPHCAKALTYSKHYMNHRGIYSCECGFKRPEPDVKLTKFVTDRDKWIITIEGRVYNQVVDDEVDINATMSVPMLGIHNLYNILCSATVYASFTKDVENINEKIEDYFNKLDFTILPPGRFEIFEVDDKLVGIGQGDNGDALKVNTLLMDLYADDEVEFIYNTPDEYEDEVFADHQVAIRGLNPAHLIVVPGRVSVDKAEDYYNQIKDEYDSDFYPVEYDFEKRINNIIGLIKDSEYKYILVSGCGEEQLVWDEVKRRLKEESS